MPMGARPAQTARHVQPGRRFMDVDIVRARAQEFCAALLAGDIGQASQAMSPELQRNLGPVVGLLPLPLASAEIESVEMTGTGFRAVLLLAGDAGATRLETRWKDRDGEPTLVEASHEAAEAPPEAAVGTDEGSEGAAEDSASA